MRGKSGFHRFDLHERVLSQLPGLGYKRPTPVQQKVIPLFLQEFNLIVEAPTGTGKTAAYGFPLISKLNLYKRSTQALVLAPSRELVFQVADALTSYFEGDLLKVEKVYGGVSLDESFQAIKSGAHIIVAVPGRLKDVMSHYRYDYLWRDIKYLIIDEGDKLMESGFQKDFDDLRKQIRKSAQVGFFSATIAEDVEELMRERYPKIKTLRLSPKEMLKNISFGIIRAEDGKRERYLVGLLQEHNIGQALIFTSKREDIFGVCGLLRNVGYRAEAYYGNQSQRERSNILHRFKEGHIDYLVASDLAARGLDIEHLPAVINIAIPREFDYYLHRVGRTGRAGSKGNVYNIVSSEFEWSWIKIHHDKIDLPLRPMTLQLPDDIPVAAEEKLIKIHLSRGKKDKIRKADVVGFLLNETSLEASKIGTITIFDQYAIVDIPLGGFEQLEESNNTLKIKGKSVKARKYQQEEMERKAMAIKKLKQDRR